MEDRQPLGRARGRGRGQDQRPAGQQPFQGPPAGGGVPPPTQVSQNQLYLYIFNIRMTKMALHI